MEKEMAIHSSVLAWRIPWTEKPGRLQSMGSHRVRHAWSYLAAAAAAASFYDSYTIYLAETSHEIKRRLLFGRKVMTKLDSIFKIRDITLPTMVHLVKAMVFPVVMYGCEIWTVKKAEHWRIDACRRRLLRVPWTAWRSVLGVHWKDWCWGWSSNTLATSCE